MRRPRPSTSVWLPLAVFPLLLTGCSVKKMAMNSVANSLSGGGTGAYLTDDDPILVGEALPFSLKLMETILLETPQHRELLIAAGSGFTLYAHAYVLQPARRAEVLGPFPVQAGPGPCKEAIPAGKRLRGEGLGTPCSRNSPGVARKDPVAAAAQLKREAVPAMYWYAAASGSAVSADKNDMDLVADLPVVSALLDRALALDEGWSQGAIHELLMVLEASGSMGSGGGSPKAEEHFRRAMELNEGRSIGPLVSMAETVCVQEQDRDRFLDFLDRALAFDVDAHPETRLANLISQGHARWLLSQADLLFVENQDPGLDGLRLHGGNRHGPGYPDDFLLPLYARFRGHPRRARCRSSGRRGPGSAGRHQAGHPCPQGDGLA